MKYYDIKNNMGNIYNFKYFAEKYGVTKEHYMDELYGVLKTLGEFYDKIYEHMVNLAVRDKWKEWQDTIKVGDVFDFSDEMLANTGDKNVDDLFILWDNVYNTIEAISKRNKIEFEGKTEGPEKA